MIPYLGRMVNRRQIAQIPFAMQEYLMRQSLNLSYDGHPVWDTYGLFVTSLMNEPSPLEQANGRVILLGRPFDKDLPQCLGVMLTRDVKQGEELTIHYGSSYYREYSVGQDCEDREYHPRKYIDTKSKGELEIAHRKILALLDVANHLGSSSDGTKDHSTAASPE